MRNNELSVGIEVIDKDDKVVGTSKVAAKKVNVVEPGENHYYNNNNNNSNNKKGAERFSCNSIKEKLIDQKQQRQYTWITHHY